MTCIRYRPYTFTPATHAVIDLANMLIERYAAQDVSLTLRSLYYRFVALYPLALDPSGEEPNTQQNYKRLGSILNRARLAGHVSWEALEDRTRNLDQMPSWTSPAEFLRQAAEWHHIDMWDNQPVRLEMWVEKDAALGAVEGVCRENDIPIFSCRGNPSQTEVWAAGQRIVEYLDRGQRFVALYAGDHDPNGLDISRDVQERLSMFADEAVELHRVALNYDQVLRFRPPPNPVKPTDSRSAGYRKRFGDECWEMDALDPAELRRMILDAINAERDPEAWATMVERRGAERAQVRSLIGSLRT